MTIIISSHILSEMHQLASSYGILHKGKLLEQLTAAELDEKCKKYLSIQVDKPEQAIAILEQALSTENYEVHNGEIRLYSYLDSPDKVLAELSNAGIGIKKVAPSGEDLESYFKSLIQRSL